MGFECCTPYTQSRNLTAKDVQQHSLKHGHNPRPLPPVGVCWSWCLLFCRDAQLEGSSDGGPKGSRRRRVRRSPYNIRNLLLVLFTMSCVIMMLYLFIWVSSSPTMADMSRTSSHPSSSGSSGQHDVAAAGGGSNAAAGHQPVAAAQQAGGVVGAGNVAGSLAAGGGLDSSSRAAEAAGRAAAVR